MIRLCPEFLNEKIDIERRRYYQQRLSQSKFQSASFVLLREIRVGSWIVCVKPPQKMLDKKLFAGFNVRLS